MSTFAPDHVLANLVESANSTPDSRDGVESTFRAGMTLTVAGALISGYLIPNWKWFDDVDDQVRAAVGGEDGPFEHQSETLRRLRDEQAFATAALDALPTRYQAALADVDTPGFIHLAGARVHTMAIGIPNPGMHWRGRLSEVTGWCFGVIAPTTNQP